MELLGSHGVAVFALSEEDLLLVEERRGREAARQLELAITRALGMLLAAK